jgi:hypothetical protein
MNPVKDFMVNPVDSLKGRELEHIILENKCDIFCYWMMIK